MATAVAAAPLTALLTASSADPLPAGLGPCSGTQCPATWEPPNNSAFLGRDAGINIFTGGDFSAVGRVAEAEGGIVVLGNVDIDKSGSGNYQMGAVGVGSQVPPPDAADFLTVGGNVTAESGNRLLLGTSAAYGNLRRGGESVGDVTVEPPGESIPDPDATASYRSLRTWVEDTSECVGKAAATGTSTLGTDGKEMTFAGDGASMKQVFNVTQDLAGADGSQIELVYENIPAGATVVVNMLGDNPVINTSTGTGQPGDRTSDMRSRLVYNFPTATTVLAGKPDSTTTLSSPGTNGRIYLAGNLVHTSDTGGYELHSYPFDGDLPDCPASPTAPATPTNSPTPTSTTPTTNPPSPASITPATSSPSPTATTPTGPRNADAASDIDPSPTAVRTDAQGELARTSIDPDSVLYGVTGLVLIALGVTAMLFAFKPRHDQEPEQAEQSEE
ncbi:choice-of-anchor A family protein [Kitasatospora sp. NPDC089913]|uniref:choice-of-anchor A family protein n=1 Tax=Kitasatospora sp. NPDC089913 TaxID=3364080 RepID=UPI0037F81899